MEVVRFIIVERREGSSVHFIVLDKQDKLDSKE
jgi:hypothetical protein